MKIFAMPSLLVALIASNAAIAESEPGFLKGPPDISVMTEVLKGAFKAEEECDYCKVNIETSYLAKQGAVFKISAPRGFAFSFGNSEFDVHSPEELQIVREFEHIAPVEDIPAIVGDALDDVDISIEGLENLLVAVTEGGYGYRSKGREDGKHRESLRELRREQRDLVENITEMELELIHVDDEDRRKEIETELKKSEKSLASYEEKEAQINAKLEAVRQANEEKRRAAREKLEQVEAERIKQMQAVAIRSLCDYGATLKNLPDNEYVSLVFERNGKEETARVYVIPKKAVEDCASSEGLLGEAITYQI